MIYEVDWRGRAAEVAGKLVADGALTDDSPWRAAFEQIPRHLFVPKFWALDEHNTLDVLVDGAEPAHYDEWLGAVYSDRVLVTRYVSRDGFRAASSSSSTPSLVARMLRVLDVHDGHRVLEIGTGTGYTTALLCHRLVDADVVSIDIDPALITEAADRLAALDYLPQLVPGDGAVGYRDSDPYDRILATCASPGVPAGWIEQLADGAVIVAPFALAGAGALAVLTKAGPMEVSGRVNPEPAFFMPLRPYADVAAPDGYFVDLPDLVAEHQQHTGPVDIGPDAFTDRDFRLWLALHFPAGARVIDRVEPPSNEGEPPRRTGVVVYTDQHRADVWFPDGDRYRVAQDRRRFSTMWRSPGGNGNDTDARPGFGSGSPRAPTAPSTHGSTPLTRPSAAPHG